MTLSLIFDDQPEGLLVRQEQPRRLLTRHAQPKFDPVAEVGAEARVIRTDLTETALPDIGDDVAEILTI